MTKYHKLVRDKIPEIIKKKGEWCRYHTADSEEYRLKLAEKLVEEAQEFQESGSREELTDLFEVVDAILKDRQWSRADIEKNQSQKARKRGAFDERIVLDES